MKKTLSILLTLLVFGATNTTLAHGPSRQKTEASITLQTPIEEVWTMLADDVCKIKVWHPAIADCSHDTTKNIRILTTKNGAVMQEKIIKIDKERYQFKYYMIEPNLEALPASSHGSIVQITKNDDGTTTVLWKGAFYRGYPQNDPPPELNDEAAIQSIKKFYQVGLKGLQNALTLTK